MLERRRGERVDSLLDDPEVDYGLGRPIGARTGLYVPLIVRDRPIGVIVAHDKSGDDPRFTNDDLRLTETFATAPPSPSTSRDESQPTRCDESSRRRSSSDGALRANCTTRPARS